MVVHGTVETTAVLRPGPPRKRASERSITATIAKRQVSLEPFPRTVPCGLVIPGKGIWAFSTRCDPPDVLGNVPWNYYVLSSTGGERAFWLCTTATIRRESVEPFHGTTPCGLVIPGKGHLGVLHWVRSTGCPWDRPWNCSSRPTGSAAAGRGHLGFLRSTLIPYHQTAVHGFGIRASEKGDASCTSSPNIHTSS